ncbi:MAG: hypothetical protein H3C48_00610 [Chitinophagaceae bacterium]|nr:hypothetical protein [Chitinophagaceae bacterium]
MKEKTPAYFRAKLAGTGEYERDERQGIQNPPPTWKRGPTWEKYREENPHPYFVFFADGVPVAEGHFALATLRAPREDGSTVMTRFYREHQNGEIYMKNKNLPF